MKLLQKTSYVADDANQLAHRRPVADLALQENEIELVQRVGQNLLRRSAV